MMNINRRKKAKSSSRRVSKMQPGFYPRRCAGGSRWARLKEEREFLSALGRFFLGGGKRKRMILLIVEIMSIAFCLPAKFFNEHV